MDKLKGIVFAASIMTAFAGVVVVKAQQEEIALLKKHNERMRTWANLMSESVLNHYDNGGHLDLSPEMSDKLDAYIIFRQNKMA